MHEIRHPMGLRHPVTKTNRINLKIRPIKKALKKEIHAQKTLHA